MFPIEWLSIPLLDVMFFLCGSDDVMMRVSSAVDIGICRACTHGVMDSTNKPFKTQVRRAKD